MLSGAVPGVYPAGAANTKYVPDNFSRAQPGKNRDFNDNIPVLVSAAYMADPRQSKLDEEGYI